MQVHPGTQPTSTPASIETFVSEDLSVCPFIPGRSLVSIRSTRCTLTCERDMLLGDRGRPVPKVEVNLFQISSAKSTEDKNKLEIHLLFLQIS